MRVVALVSGGKDSVFTMMEAEARGHTVVALANLRPVDEACEELDSHMFQTAGHGMIELLAACLPDRPMYRRTIRGGSHSVSMRYERDAGDEVEDLAALLAGVLRRHPEVQAVCCGAILSNFQRLRVEHVCQRLGLASLAFLWEREQTSLLDAMIGAGIEAVLVKVAAMGLVPAKHLGQSLRVMRPLLKKLETDFGCSVCGEGGEYESFVLDCPLFANRIELVSVEKNALSSDPIAPVGLLRVLEARVVDKRTNEVVRERPPIVFIEDDFIDLQDKIALPECGLAPDPLPAYFSRTLYLDNYRDWDDLVGHLAGFPMRLLFVSVQTNDITTFAAFNSVYKKYFPSEPPSRAVWQPSSNANRKLHIRGVYCAESSAHLVKSHHVQSVSCWAPACIGPYSQALTYRNVCWISGQIPLVPDTMVLPADQSLAMCERHALAVAKSQGCSASFVFCLALFVGPGGKQYRLGIKDYIGENFGYIATIREKEVVIIQTIEENQKRYSTTKVVFLNE